MSYTLLVDGGNFRAFKILIAAEYNGVSIDVPAFTAGTDNKTPAFLAKSPMGRVPVLDTPAGSINESNAIARYVANMRRDTELMGSTFFDSAKVDSWVDFCAHEIELPACVWYYPAFGYMPANDAATAKAKEDLANALKVLEKHLKDKTFLVGHKVSLADITIASALVYPFKFVADAAYRKPFPNVMRWFDLCVHQPQFQAVVGDVALCKTELTSGAAPITNSSNAKKGGKGGDKKEKKEKAPKEKKEKAPKAEKKVAVVEEEPKPVKKPPHPFAVMDKENPSSFSMDNWKKTYSNCNTYEEALDEFWKTFDPKGWTIFRGDYNHNEEHEKLFMTGNLIGGFIQRTEEIRKWLFGTMSIRGVEEPGKMKVSAYFLIRGDSIKPLQDANGDADYYTWTAVPDVPDAATKETIFRYWTAEDGLLDGEELLDNRVYK